MHALSSLSAIRRYIIHTPPPFFSLAWFEPANTHIRYCSVVTAVCVICTGNRYRFMFCLLNKAIIFHLLCFYQILLEKLFSYMRRKFLDALKSVR